jgi:hypothetical protein
MMENRRISQLKHLRNIMPLASEEELGRFLK